MSVRLVIQDSGHDRWLEFRNPVCVLTAGRPDEVIPVLREVDRLVGTGLHAAGAVMYEAAPAFDTALHAFPPGDLPLVWFGLFPAPSPVPIPSLPATPENPLHWSPTITEEEYRAAIRVIREHIHQGDTYQVNFTFRLTAGNPPDPWGLFVAMVHAQGSRYGAYMELDRWVICSASPELFFRLEGDRLIAKPMKGTAPRGLWPAADDAQREALLASTKTRAENLMIVDMVRNDLSRVATGGSVHPAAMFTAERYPTLWQLTSTVECTTDAPVADIMRSLFPPASITGAPKVRTTAIIRELETTRRNVYTGTIGFCSPGHRAQFNVAIRTVLIDRDMGRAEYGTGSGIVWDSDDRDEYAECLLKAGILTQQRTAFSLLETLLWTPDPGYALLERHMERLGSSAAYFDYPWSRSRAEQALRDLERTLSPRPHRVRLLLSPEGESSAEASAFEPAGRYRVCLARKPVDTASVFFYHKTTERGQYRRALDDAPGYDDVLLWNVRGELTESTRANIVVEKDGVLLTPPVDCGLLGGVYRAELLARGTIREAHIEREELPRCSRIFLVNALRGMWEVRPEVPA